MITKFTTILLAISTTFSCYAEVISQPENFSGSGAEYFVGREYGRPLVTVSLLSGVNRPGVYHIPIQTTLPQLLAFAGGTLNNAEVEDIRIRRVDADKPTVVKFDLNSLMKDTKSMPILQDKDLIQIPQSTSMDNSIRWTTLLAGLASIALSVSLVNQINHHP